MAGPSRLALSAISSLKQPTTLHHTKCIASQQSRRSPLILTAPCRNLSVRLTSRHGLAARSSTQACRWLSSTSITRSPSTSNGETGETGEVTVKQMTAEAYEQVSERDMDLLHDKLEELCEEYAPEDWEVEYSSGVMNLSAPPNGTYVINKQPPNQQIWLSSPLSGPMRFGYSPDGKWVHHRRSDVTLGRILEDELRGLLKDSGGEQGWKGPGLE